MRFDKVLLESYGEASNRLLDFSRGDFCLAFGPNEAGKSTFLEFVRNLLFDLPSGNGAPSTFFSSTGAATLGGRAEFRLSDGTPGRLARYWRSTGARRTSTFEASLRDPKSGAERTLDEAAFGRLLDGADRRFFANYFGFSYRELAAGEAALTSSTLADLIYGVGLGDAKAFERTRGALDKELKALFSPAGNARTQTINRAVKELKNVAAAIKEASGSVREYSALEKEIGKAERDGKKVRERREAKAAERDERKKSRDARALFRAARDAAEAAESFVAASRFSVERLTAFPESATAERRSAAEASRRAAEELDEATDERATILAGLERIDVRTEYLTEEARIARAFGGSVAVATERDALPRDEADAAREANEIERRARELGVDASAEALAAGTTSATALERAKSGAAEEVRLDEARRAASAAARERRAEIAEFERELMSARERAAESFGTRDRSADAVDFGRVAERWTAARGEFDRAAKAIAKSEAARRAEAAEARRLAEIVSGTPTDADVAALENAPLLLGSTADGWADELAEIDRTRAATRAEVARLDGELAKLAESAAASRDWGAASAEELAKARRERDERWAAFKTGDRGVETAFAFERALARADEIADERFANAKAVVDWETAKRTTAQKSAERRAAVERIETANAAAEAVRTRAFERLTALGFAVRADFSVAEAREWRDRWEGWRAARLETDGERAELDADVARLVRVAEETRTSAGRWLDAGAGGDSPNDLTALAAATERDVARARARVERWREATAEIERLAKAVDDASRKARRFDAEERSAEAARARSRAESAAFAAELGLDGARSFAELAATLERISALQTDARRVAETRARLDARRRAVAEFDAETSALAAALGEPLGEGTRPEDAARKWERRLRDARAAAIERKNAEDNLAKVDARIGAKREKIAEIQAGLRAGLDALGVESEREFDELGAAAAEARRLFAVQGETASRLRAAFVGCDDAEFERRLQTLRETENDEELDAKLAETERELAELDGESKEIDRRAATARARLDALNSEAGAGALVVERERVANELREAIDLCVPRLMASRALTNSLNRCERERLPQILDDANEIFARTTFGRYSKIVVDEADGSFRAIQRDGVAKTPRELSSGTREQLYLALRLAHTRQYCRRSEPLPTLIDDVLVNFDDRRAKETLRVLADFAQTTQVVLLTCRESTRAAFEEIVGRDAVVELPARRFDAEIFEKIAEI